MRLKQTFSADLPKRDRILNGSYAYPELLEGLFPLWKTGIQEGQEFDFKYVMLVMFRFVETGSHYVWRPEDVSLFPR